ncbi:hypothetical protein Y032_1125g3641 [Ancylostoma ceylanicum]|uniref:Uncharacterized protein n=1 Tax=Ancylostoma ceylanicum TaxID=53326 RepID=A0A016W6B2_9BILA|nr:hypothetical protein Y032_1125g3641 [Ancylostoma ceylanicum]
MCASDRMRFFPSRPYHERFKNEMIPNAPPYQAIPVVLMLSSNRNCQVFQLFFYNKRRLRDSSADVFRHRHPSRRSPRPLR